MLLGVLRTVLRRGEVHQSVPIFMAKILIVAENKNKFLFASTHKQFILLQ